MRDLRIILRSGQSSAVRHTQEARPSFSSPLKESRTCSLGCKDPALLDAAVPRTATQVSDAVEKRPSHVG